MDAWLAIPLTIFLWVWSILGLFVLVSLIVGGILDWRQHRAERDFARQEAMAAHPAGKRRFHNVSSFENHRRARLDGDYPSP